MADNVRNLRDGQLTIRDQAATTWHTVTLDEGNLSWTEHQNVIQVMDRGVLSHVRKGDEQAIDVSFGIKFHDFHGEASATLAYEAIKGVNNASTWDSTRNEDVYTVSLDFIIFNTTDAVSETVYFYDFFWETIDFAEGDEFDTLAVTGKSFSTAPTISP